MSEKTRPCEICLAPIDPERAELLPETRLCVEHAREMSKYGGEYLVAARQTSLGKGGSLKKNYGDVSLLRKRNIEGLARLRRECQDRQQATEGDGSP
jgi:hypothetical protein